MTDRNVSLGVHPNYSLPDAEERALELAVRMKLETIAALNMAAEARRARGGDTTDIDEGIAYEELVIAGYNRALNNRRRALAAAARERAAAERGGL